MIPFAFLSRGGGWSIDGMPGGWNRNKANDLHNHGLRPIVFFKERKSPMER
jgi:hypothetical protein